ncbi:hypothetical protein QUF64_10075 [Anaerolineales bacterium HSG6]|nr:hypothetical protein [Anaerolineales bacterium HSG6]MDM8531376.1 hypothetical protein [Anaerolineales bacterium HSG25]
MDEITTTNSGEMEVIPPGAVTPASSDMAGTIQEMSQKLATMLRDVVNDMSKLEIKTYTSKDLERSSLVKLRATTEIHLDGDVSVTIPEAEGADGQTQIDDKVWTIHKEMVEMAQDKRVEFIKALGQVAGSLLKE